MTATETRAARVIAGSDTWAIDLNQHSHGFTSSDTLNETNEPASERRWVERLLTEYSRTISVPVVFYGEATEALAPRTNGVSLLVLGDAGAEQGWLGGSATWISIPRVAPQSGIVSGGVEFMQREAWATGRVAVPFTFQSEITGDNPRPAITSVTLPTFPNTSTAYLAVTGKTVSGNRVLTVSDGTDNVAITFPSVGVRKVELSTLTNNIDSGTVTVAELTGDNTISGYFVAGTEYTIPSGVLT